MSKYKPVSMYQKYAGKNKRRCASLACRKDFRFKTEKQKFCCEMCRINNQNKKRRVNPKWDTCHMYIHIISDDIPLAIKFGLEARGDGSRLVLQKWKTPFDVDRYGLWVFDHVDKAYAAERDCRQSLHCGVLHRTDFQDGFTETTYLYNIDTVVEIYERHGGILVT